MEVFSEVLPLKPKREEAFREDFTLFDYAGKTVALAAGLTLCAGFSQCRQALGTRWSNAFHVQRDLIAVSIYPVRLLN
jgi:hypothetical protein